MTKYSLSILSTAAAALLSAASVEAASITWATPTGISGDSDVSTTGSLVGAFAVGDTGVSNTTVNGVLFQGFAVPLGTTGANSGNFSIALNGNDIFLSINDIFGSPSTPFSNLSSSYQALLSSAALTAQPTTFDLTMSGLTIGQQYQFQWWANLSGPATTSTLHSAIAGNAVTLNDNTSGIEGGIGQYVIGTFIADATNQKVRFAPVPPQGPNSYAQLNAFQLRAIPAVPEPASLLIGCLPFGVLLLSRCFRRESSSTPKA